MSALTYADAGVDLKAWHDARERIGALVTATHNTHVLGGFGQFGSMFDAAALKDMEHPVLVSSVDGVGTKLKIAFEMNRHDTVGEDIVNHCIDDILVMGARPLFFLDYVATGKLCATVIERIVGGMSRACVAADCVLIGGETAEMPGFYRAGEYDIAGTIVGVVDKARIIDGRHVAAGDALIGLRSNGLHTNGYSLARKIVTETAGRAYTDSFADTGRSFGEELLRPHRSYRALHGLMQTGRIKGCAHITGGGFQENVNRMLPASCDAIIETGQWRPDPVFVFLQREGRVEPDEMYRSFNMGIGMVLAVAASDVKQVCASAALAAWEPRIIGRVVAGSGTVRMEYEDVATA